MKIGLKLFILLASIAIGGEFSSGPLIDLDFTKNEVINSEEWKRVVGIIPKKSLSTHLEIKILCMIEGI